MSDYSIRLILLGNNNTGKTYFANKLVNNIYYGPYTPTIGVDYFSTIINKEDKTIKCHIWDTAGQKKFSPLLVNYYHNIGGAIFVYDINKKNTFRDIEFWLNELNKYGPKYNIKKILIGNIYKNKTREVSKEEIDEFCKKHDFVYYEINIKKLKNQENILNNIIMNMKVNKTINLNRNIKLDEEYEEEKSNRCCWF